VSVLEILVVDDDADYLKGLEEALPDKIADKDVFWTYEPSFEGAVQMLSRRRFDLVIADVYLGDAPKGEIETGTVAVGEIISAIQSARFCPLVTFSSGSRPEEIVDSAFLRFVQKGSNVEDLIRTVDEVVATGIPQVARAIHDEIDQASSTYLWKFLVSEWERLSTLFNAHDGLFERLVKRRVAISLARLNPDGVELGDVEGAEYFLYPPISKTLKLGEILKHEESGDCFVILTPRCHLVLQPGATAPRADNVLLAKIVGSEGPLTGLDWPKKPEKKASFLRRQIGIPSEVGSPSGRYWFVPGFLDISEGFVDFMQVKSVPYADIATSYSRIAVLDTPYAESLQNLFVNFYAALGTPVLVVDRFSHLMPNDTRDEAST